MACEACLVCWNVVARRLLVGDLVAERIEGVVRRRDVLRLRLRVVVVVRRTDGMVGMERSRARRGARRRGWIMVLRALVRGLVCVVDWG